MTIFSKMYCFEMQNIVIEVIKIIGEVPLPLFI